MWPSGGNLCQTQGVLRDFFFHQVPLTVYVFIPTPRQKPRDLLKLKHMHTAYRYYIPGTQMTSIFEGQPPQNKAFSNQNKGHLGSR